MIMEGIPRGVVAKVLVCDIVVGKFELQWCYYIQFRTNTFGKGMNPLEPLKIIQLLFFLQYNSVLNLEKMPQKRLE